MTHEEIENTVDAMRITLNDADEKLPRAARFGWQQSLYPNTLEGFDGQANYDLSLMDDGRWACSAHDPLYMPGWMTSFHLGTDPAKGEDVGVMVARVREKVREEWRRQYDAAHPLGL